MKAPAPAWKPPSATVDLAAHKTLCRQWKYRLKAVHRRPMVVLEDLAAGVKHGLSSVTDVKKHLAAARQMEKQCADPKFAGIFGRRCYWERNKRSPATSCRAARRAPELVRAAVKTAFHRRLIRSNGRWPALSDMKKRSGYITEGKPLTHAAVTGVTAAEKRLYHRRMRPLLAAAGVASHDDAQAWARVAAHRTAVKAWIQSSARGYAAPAMRGHRSVGKTAARQIRARHIGRKVTIIASGADRVTWIHEKSSTGIPLSRTVTGHTLFRLAGEPWCQLRPWDYTETHTGGGRYQRASSVQLGFVRFQRCR